MRAGAGENLDSHLPPSTRYGLIYLLIVSCEFVTVSATSGF